MKSLPLSEVVILVPSTLANLNSSFSFSIKSTSLVSFSSQSIKFYFFPSCSFSFLCLYMTKIIFLNYITTSEIFVWYKTRILYLFLFGVLLGQFHPRFFMTWWNTTWFLSLQCYFACNLICWRGIFVYILPFNSFKLLFLTRCTSGAYFFTKLSVLQVVILFIGIMFP